MRKRRLVSVWAQYHDLMMIDPACHPLIFLYVERYRLGLVTWKEWSESILC